MAANTVRARLSFSFRAEDHEPDAVLDLDTLAESGEEPDFHLLLAKAAGIDPYSYLYEVLESHEIEFSEATGLAARCCDHGRFDWRAFLLLRDEELELRVLRTIAAGTLGVRDLDGLPGLKAALLAAYRAGRSGRES
jgi:hypothetical protein